VYAGVAVYSLIIMVINPLIRSNYLYFSQKPDFPTLLDYMGPWPWYILVIQVTGAITCLVLYLPFYWKDHKDKKQYQSSELSSATLPDRTHMPT
jgi:uncharacterized membrane protein YwaF